MLNEKEVLVREDFCARVVPASMVASGMLNACLPWIVCVADVSAFLISMLDMYSGEVTTIVVKSKEELKAFRSLRELGRAWPVRACNLMMNHVF